MDRHDQSDELIRSKPMMPHKFKQALTSCFFVGHVEGIDAATSASRGWSAGFP